MKLPPVVETDTVRVIRVPDIMHLYWLSASIALIEKACDRDDLRVVEELSPIGFIDGRFSRALCE